MRVFFFKEQSLDEPPRDDQGAVVLNPNSGKPMAPVKWYKIEFKVMASKCSIDFKSYERWSALKLTELFEADGEEEALQKAIRMEAINYIMALIDQDQKAKDIAADAHGGHLEITEGGGE